MRKIAVLFFAIPICLAPVIRAQQSQPQPGVTKTIDPNKLALIEEMFRLTKPEQVMQQALNQLKASFEAQTQKAISDQVRTFGDPAKYQAQIDQFQERLLAVIEGQFAWPKVKPQFIALYDQAFTTDQIRAIVSFYKSPAGQVMLEKMPLIMQKGAEIGREQMVAVLPQLQDMTMDFVSQLRAQQVSSSPK